MKRKGFTLIELLVVIAIIAILAAILFPVFAKAREKARQSSCQSNAKQIGVALISYSQDYDETVVRAWFGNGGYNPSDPNTNSLKYKWMDAIYPQIKNTQVFSCPSLATHKYIPFQQLPNGAASDQYYGSYAINAAYWNHNGTHTAPAADMPGMSLARFAQPASTVWASDGYGSYQFAWDNNDPGISNTNPRYFGWNNTDMNNGSLVETHSEMANILWCDGHVKSMKLDAIRQERTDNGFVYSPSLTVEDD